MKVVRAWRCGLLVCALGVLSACVHQPAHDGLDGSSDLLVSTEMKPMLESKLPSEEQKANAIFYQPNETEVAPSYRALLGRHGQRLKANPKAALKIVGYTDDEGSSAYNLAVAQERVEKVAIMLRGMGAARQQLQRYPVGSEKSHCQGDAECRRLMRRVDLEPIEY